VSPKRGNRKRSRSVSKSPPKLKKFKSSEKKKKSTVSNYDRLMSQLKELEQKKESNHEMPTENDGPSLADYNLPTYFH